MAGSKSNFLENRILDCFLRNQAAGQVATVYIGLFTTAPTDAGGGTEVSGNAYARRSIAFDAAVNGVTQNTSTISFPTATPGNWGTIVAAGIFDALTGGNLLYWFDFDTPQFAEANFTFRLAVGSVVIGEE